MRTFLGVTLVLALGCGGGQKPKDNSMVPATEAQCREMANHMLDVQIASRVAAERPSGQEEAEIREGIVADFVPYCVRDVLMPTYECWMAAQTVEALESCTEGEPHPETEGAGPDPVPTSGDTEPGDPSP